jgi:hypothetical protein
MFIAVVVVVIIIIKISLSSSLSRYRLPFLLSIFCLFSFISLIVSSPYSASAQFASPLPHFLHIFLSFFYFLSHMFFVVFFLPSSASGLHG